MRNICAEAIGSTAIEKAAFNMKTKNDSTDSSANRVLMVSAVFGPNGGPGVQRSAKFAKYLPQFGWHPTVWTAGQLPELPEDASLIADLPTCVKIYDRGELRDGERESESRGQSFLSGALAWRFQAMHHRYSQPDPLVDWARASVAPLIEKIESGAFDAIYSTYSPASNHLLALSLKRHTGCPWVADFRDLWTDDYRYAEATPKWRRAHRRWEQEILEVADVVVGVTPTQTEILASHVPAQANKFVTITNGFDADDFHGQLGNKCAQDRPTFELTYVGSADHWRTSESLFEGLAAFAAKCQDKGSQFVLRVVGHVSASVKARFDATGAQCVYAGRVDHASAIEAMRTARALLLCVPEGANGDSVVPAKLYEYLATHCPILLVGPVEGDAARIVGDRQAGVCVTFDGDKINRAVGEVFAISTTSNHNTCEDFPSLNCFRRDVLAKALSEQLERACEVSAKTCTEQTPMVEVVV